MEGIYYDDPMGMEAGLYHAQGFRMSKGAYLLLTLVQQVCVGGVIFGWQALLPVLYETGVFEGECPPGSEPRKHPCLAMRSKLALVFSIAGSASAVGALVAGLLMDYWGTRVARMFACLVVLAGALMIANADKYELLWFPGLAAMGFGGNGLQITSFHVSNLFVGNERLVVSVITGSFAASSCLFTFFRIFYEQFQWSLRDQFMIYTGVAAMCFLTSSVWPVKPFSSPDDLDPPDDKMKRRKHMDYSAHSEYWTDGSMTPQGSSCGDDSGHGFGSFYSGEDALEPLMGGLGDLGVIPEAPIQPTNQLCLDLSQLPLSRQLVTPEWISLLLFFIAQLLTSTFYLTAVGDQLSCWACGCWGQCGEGECMKICPPAATAEASQWLTLFGVVFPLGFITTPLVGFLQDRYQMSILLMFVNACFLFWQLSAIVPDMNAQAATLVVYSSARQFLFSFFFAAVGSTFGYENFGFLTGLANGISAFVLLLNAPLYELAASRFTETYGAFAGVSVIFFFVAWYLKNRFHRVQMATNNFEWDISEHPSGSVSPRLSVQR